MIDADIKQYAEAFQRDGFVHVPGVFDRNELERYAAAVDEAVATRKAGDTRALDEKSPYEQSFMQCQYIWEDFPRVRPLTFHPKVGELTAALLGTQKVRLWHDQALYKEAGGRGTDAHQDQPYWPIAESDTATVWIPFQRTDDETGCMGYVPGSQASEAEFVDIFRTPGAGEAFAKKFGDPVYVHCEPGDVIFHSGFTVHMAKPNKSDRTRRVYTAIYFADGSHRHGDRPHPSVDRDHIAEGDVIDGGATPIVWPLENGRMPEPEPWPEMGLEWHERAERLGIIPKRS